MGIKAKYCAPDRNHLTENYKKYRKQFEGREIPLPPHWGGYRVIPTEFEFWQGVKTDFMTEYAILKKEIAGIFPDFHPRVPIILTKKRPYVISVTIYI